LKRECVIGNQGNPGNASFFEKRMGHRGTWVPWELGMHHFLKREWVIGNLWNPGNASFFEKRRGHRGTWVPQKYYKKKVIE